MPGRNADSGEEAAAAVSAQPQGDGALFQFNGGIAETGGLRLAKSAGRTGRAFQRHIPIPGPLLGPDASHCLTFVCASSLIAPKLNIHVVIRRFVLDRQLLDDPAYFVREVFGLGER